MILDDKQDAVTDPGASIRQVTPEPSRKRPAPPAEPPRPSVRISLLYLSSNANSLLQKAAAKGKEVRHHPSIRGALIYETSKVRRGLKEAVIIDDTPSKKSRLDPEGPPAFSDSPFIVKGIVPLPRNSIFTRLLPGTSMTIENEKVAACLKATTDLLKDPSYKSNPSELVTHCLIGELQAEIICDLHKIDFIMKRRVLLVDQLALLQRGVDTTTAAATSSD